MITFIAGFVPIVGAVVAGALAVLGARRQGVGRRSDHARCDPAGPATEGNVLQPLQAKVMELHAAIVLLSVMLGGSMFGIAGAFLAVPVVATVAVIFRYANEQLSRKAGRVRRRIRRPILPTRRQRRRQSTLLGPRRLDRRADDGGRSAATSRSPSGGIAT